jgi:anthranilate/para-aminobenzoate synthase component II
MGSMQYESTVANAMQVVLLAPGPGAPDMAVLIYALT